MSTAPSRSGLGLGSWLLLILCLLLAGAAAATWTLTRWDGAARFFGVSEPEASPERAPMLQLAPAQMSRPLAEPTLPDARVDLLERRVAQLEGVTQRVAGSAGRADAILVAFAARRAVDRGVPLGYLETLLTERFGPQHPQAVATVITASRTPVRLDQLSAEFETLAPTLKAPGPEAGVWEGVKRELGSLISIRRANRPNTRPTATYERARAKLAAGQVDQALAEAMRLPGIGRAGGWVRQARVYVTAHRALDELESAALLDGER